MRIFHTHPGLFNFLKRTDIGNDLNKWFEIGMDRPSVLPKLIIKHIGRNKNHKNRHDKSTFNHKAFNGGDQSRITREQNFRYFGQNIGGNR